jgi:membrane-associated protease RseP (regulator of RpoE activity)
MVLGIVAMVFVHELGHFVVAKRAGMKVTEFFIGFGPRIWSFRRGETEYGVKAIPAGAYVKIIGMHNLEEVEPGDEARAYRQGRFRSRFSVVVAGVAMNFLTALVLIWAVLAVFGVPGGTITGELDTSEWSIGEVYPGSGADEGGLRSGDKIVEVAGTPIGEFNDLRDVVQDRRGETVDVTVQRAGNEVTVPVALRPFAAAGERRSCCLGVSPAAPAVERVGPLAAVPQSLAEFGGITTQSVAGLGRFFTPGGLSDFGNQVATAHQDDTGTTVGGDTGGSGSGSGSGGEERTGENRLLSLLGVFQIGTAVAETGVSSLLLLFVVLNIFLGIVNLVPLLPFDGGHAVIAAYEKAQEVRRRGSGRYFADISRLMPLTYLVVVLLAGIFLTTLYLDIINPIDLK